MVLSLLLIMAALLDNNPLHSRAIIWTDQEYYGPSDTVSIYGSGFTPDTNILVAAERPGSAVDEWVLTSDNSGAFKTRYEPDEVAGLFQITATDGTNTATRSFTRAVQADWVQCEDDSDNDDVVDSPMCHWVTGSLNRNNAILTEGNIPPPYPSAIPGHVNYRAVFEGCLLYTSDAADE